MHPVFAAAAIFGAPRVLVYRLKPFQLGHAWLLEALQSPYLVGGDISKNDLALAAWVCSQDATDSIEAVKRGGQPSFVARAVALACSKMDWKAHDAIFSAYVERAMQAPRRWGSGVSSAPRAAWQWIAAVQICAGDISRLTTAWNTPLLDVTCFTTTQQVISGDDGIVSEEEEQMSERLKESTP